MMRSVLHGWETEGVTPFADVEGLGRVLPSDRLHALDGIRLRVDVINDYERVDDGLCGQSGDRGGAHVIDGPNEPRVSRASAIKSRPRRDGS